MLGVIRSLFMGSGSQLVATLQTNDSVTRGKETYPSPFAYQVTQGTINALTAAAVVISLALPDKKRN
jgi:hypothetical protein